MRVNLGQLACVSLRMKLSCECADSSSLKSNTNSFKNHLLMQIEVCLAKCYQFQGVFVLNWFVWFTVKRFASQWQISHTRAGSTNINERELIELGARAALRFQKNFFYSSPNKKLIKKQIERFKRRHREFIQFFWKSWLWQETTNWKKKHIKIEKSLSSGFSVPSDSAALTSFSRSRFVREWSNKTRSQDRLHANFRLIKCSIDRARWWKFIASRHGNAFRLRFSSRQ